MKTTAVLSWVRLVKWFVIPGLLVLPACERSGETASPSATLSGIGVKSVDPYHALVEAPAGSIATPFVFVMEGEHSSPDLEAGEFEQATEEGGLRFVLDLLPGGSLTLWTAPSEEAGAEDLGGRTVATSTNVIAAAEDGGTGATDAPSLSEAKIRFTSLDGHHALLEGDVGAAAGESLYISYGAHEEPVEGAGLSRGLRADGSFQTVFDIAPGGEITLWSISGEHHSAPLTRKAAE